MHEWNGDMSQCSCVSATSLACS